MGVSSIGLTLPPVNRTQVALKIFESSIFSFAVLCLSAELLFITCFGKACSIEVCSFLCSDKAFSNIEAGSWIIQVNRGFCHFKISNAAIDAIGDLQSILKKKKSVTVQSKLKYSE